MFTSEYENAINKQFAKNLRHFLDRYNYTQLSFAKKMNVRYCSSANFNLFRKIELIFITTLKYVLLKS